MLFYFFFFPVVVVPRGWFVSDCASEPRRRESLMKLSLATPRNPIIVANEVRLGHVPRDHPAEQRTNHEEDASQNRTHAREQL